MLQVRTCSRTTGLLPWRRSMGPRPAGLSARAPGPVPVPFAAARLTDERSLPDAPRPDYIPPGAPRCRRVNDAVPASPNVADRP